ncbi:uncharacterized protein LOC106720825 [Papilio machaon]|uniref:uncharacterized protein LOC106720825 n=1 Tax=Papilio machaon TaxID=76193 RepID=UPI001E66583F|nr:uncharacterized protein LOC106720825 [Papilio machaon]
MMLQRLFLAILCAINAPKTQRCTLNTRVHFGQPLPVILRNGQLLEPTDNDGNIVVQYGDSITLSCIDQGSIRNLHTIQGRNTATINCINDDVFGNDEWLISPSRFSEFKCTSPPSYVSERTNRTCYDENVIYEVGYKIDNVFYPVYESCFNELELNAIYSKYTQKPYNALYQTRVERPFFIDNNVYGYVSVNSLFSPARQKSAVAQLVGDRVNSYVNKTEFLSRGHLAAKTDFALAFGERATFHYVNCAPQWVGFNGGNWNTLEVDLRNHIHDVGYSTIIYTGTFGVSQLVNQHGTVVDIYLHTDVNNNPVIPVPKYYYKVVYEPNSKRGIAFVGINNPHYTRQEAQNLFFCSDLCRGNDNFSWLTWHPDLSSEGYTFCCTVADFRQTVRHLPHFEVSGLLT